MEILCMGNAVYKRRYNWKRRGWSKEQCDMVEEILSRTTICKICGESRKLHVDHCHKTGKFRGILCHKCNRALGFFKDDPALLRRAADYIDKYGNVVYN